MGIVVRMLVLYFVRVDRWLFGIFRGALDVAKAILADNPISVFLPLIRYILVPETMFDVLL